VLWASATFSIFAQPSLPQPEGRSGIDFLAIELTICFRFKKRVYFLQQSTCLGRMAAIRPKNTFGVVGERSLLPIDPAELAATEKRGAVDILAIEFWIS
jgi:hypothetical protein